MIGCDFFTSKHPTVGSGSKAALPTLDTTPRQRNGWLRLHLQARTHRRLHLRLSPQLPGGRSKLSDCVGDDMGAMDSYGW